MQTIDLDALATTVTGKLTAILEDFAELGAITEAVATEAEAVHAARPAHLTWEQSYSDQRLAKVVARAIRDIQTAISDNKGHGLLAFIAYEQAGRAHHHYIAAVDAVAKVARENYGGDESGQTPAIDQPAI